MATVELGNALELLSKLCELRTAYRAMQKSVAETSALGLEDLERKEWLKDFAQVWSHSVQGLAEASGLTVQVQP